LLTLDSSDDLRPFNISWDFIFQGTHRTTRGFVDKIDLNVKKDDNCERGTSCSILRAFSRSGIHGALGDNGQNYKTLAFMRHHLAPEKAATTKVLYGCGGK